ncbi:hypothetical protein L1987_79674 [Smallanthus sonchifolius]|uniref:Uncharacterized protein n=1 Tax=Smallanthus sonchifolius TaxID=185202 RepID=A0ACB8YPR5_9ASTR|nr:hypothetical protein L1987_79674 [Smallanthus sonchifolius]
MKKGPPLLVCFPTRSHLTMMPKMICSPSRLTSITNLNHLHHHRGKSSGSGDSGGLWSKKNPMGSELSEPTSPKVTCVGQIKARPKSRSCKNWQSVMEEIERIHNNKKHRKKPSWGDAIGFKKESMQFLTCLRSFKLDLGCFGAFPSANVTSDDENDDDETNSVKKTIGFEGYDHDDKDEHGHEHGEDIEEGSSRSAFSKWIMVLEDNQDCLHGKEEIGKPKDDDNDDDDEAQAPCVPPSNALLLMRCRSASTKSLLEEEEEEEEEEAKDDDDDDEHDGIDDDQHDVGKKRENLMELMKYEGDFYKLSCDIAKETWVVGGINQDSFSKTQAQKKCSIECLQEVKACLQ